MDTNTNTNRNTQSQTKTKSESKYTGIRLTKTTAAKLKKVLNHINKKDYGNSVRIDTLVNYLITKMPKDIVQELQENSLSEEDKFLRDYKKYCSESGKVTREEFFKLVRQGLVFQPSQM